MKAKFINFIKVSMLTVLCIGGMMCSNVTVVKAEPIIHTHIWATKYDDSKHWEYCTVCAKTRNVEEHKCEDHWFEGKESCWHKTYSTRICKCGYNYIYHKPHKETSEWKNQHDRLLHFKICTDCGTWVKSERCKDAEGYLSCKNPGTCLTCGNTTNSDNHYMTKDGKCRDCGVQLVKISQAKVSYASDYKEAYLEFTMTPALRGLELTGVIGAYSGDPNYSKVDWKTTKHSNGSYTYKATIVFNPKTQRKCTLNIADRSNIAKVNGTSIYGDASLVKETVWQDHTKPEVTNVAQKDQATCNTWATIKELTITGTEDLSSIVTISIIDKASGDVIVDKAKTEVKDKKYTYACTPPLEGPKEGRTYTLRVVDEIGNQTDKDFVIYKTDCRAPIIRSSKEFTTWSQTKNLVFDLTDYGAGKAQTSLSNQTSYKDTVLENDMYKAKYTFDEDFYGVKEYKLYVRDGLGNAALDTIKVGRVDNTKPTIADLKFELKYAETAESENNQENTAPTGVIITVTANDINTTLSAEGSGVAGYALVDNNGEPKEEDWKEENTLEITKAGTYYLWVKDLAGNMADVKVLNVKEDFSAEMGDDIEVQEDKQKVSKGEDDKKEEVAYDEDDATPATGDKSYIFIAGMLMLVSGVIVLVIRNKKKRVFGE